MTRQKLGLGLVVVILGLWIILPLVKPTTTHQIGHIPVLHEGRVKPLDTVARTSLLQLNGKQSIQYNDTRLSAIDWLAHTMLKPEIANQYPVFKLPKSMRQLLGLSDTQSRFSYAELTPYFVQLQQHLQVVEQIEPEDRTSFQQSILVLAQKLTMYTQIQRSFWRVQGRPIKADIDRVKILAEEAHILIQKHPEGPQNLTAADRQLLEELSTYINTIQLLADPYFLALPPRSTANWEAPHQSYQAILGQGIPHPDLASWIQILDDYPARSQALTPYLAGLTQLPQSKLKFENHFNDLQLFYKSTVLYGLGFLAVFLSWLVWPNFLTRLSGSILGLAFFVHTVGIIFRVFLQGRPPITNLYSSAVAVGWVAIGVGFAIEYFYRNRIGYALSALIGFLTLIVAHHLSMQGDTLEMMRAVLDSNFWLSTHVTCMVVGYGATFVAGTIGLIYIITQLLGRSQDIPPSQWTRMIYGTTGFALLFSFIGTVLGGFWGDQSWGRFWGWDPKENGALLIILWLTMILHVRLAGWVKLRGLMCLSVIGNIITAWSWFGVNMLGVGLHSYGFMDKAFLWLVIFVCSQLLIAGIGAFHPRVK